MRTSRPSSPLASPRRGGVGSRDGCDIGVCREEPYGTRVESILDPWPARKEPIWEFFGSECAYCGVKLVKGQRRGHIDHATSNAGNHMGNLVLACSVCNGDEKLDMDWREFLEQKVSDWALRQARIERIERWRALHPKSELTASPEVAALEAELRTMIVAFGEKCAELRAAVTDAKSATTGSDG
jgi:hypothetical protein